MKDDEEPITSRPQFDVDRLSIDDLKSRIIALTQEIADCEAAIARKQNTRSDADALFSFGGSGKPGASGDD